MENIGYYIFFGLIICAAIFLTIQYYSMPVANASFFIIKENQVNITNNYTVLKVENVTGKTVVTASTIGMKNDWFYQEQVTNYQKITMNTTKKFNLGDVIKIDKIMNFPVCGLEVFYPNGTSTKQSADLQYSGNFRLNYLNSESMVCIEQDKNLFDGKEVTLDW